MNARRGAGLLVLPALLVTLCGPAWADPLPDEIRRFRQHLLSIRLPIPFAAAHRQRGRRFT
jgi:hypothetical protein